MTIQRNFRLVATVAIAVCVVVLSGTRKGDDKREGARLEALARKHSGATLRDGQVVPDFESQMRVLIDASVKSATWEPIPIQVVGVQHTDALAVIVSASGAAYLVRPNATAELIQVASRDAASLVPWNFEKDAEDGWAWRKVNELQSEAEEWGRTIERVGVAP